MAGSFDPVHFGHLDIIKRAARDFDLTVLVANNPSKKYMFTLEERARMLLVATRLSTIGVPVNVVMLKDPHQLTADWAFENGVPVIVRGVRSFADYDMESMIRDINISQQNGVETYFLKCDQKLSHISSGAVKELFSHAGFIHEYVPLSVKREVERKAGLHIIGVTGNIASGKNWICEKLMADDMNIHHLDMDKLAHFILFESVLPAHADVRRQIRETFTLFDKIYREDLTEPLSSVERVSLGNFADAGERAKLNAIMGKPIITALRRALSVKKGIVLLNTALLAEFNLAHICNNTVVLVTTDNATRNTRLQARGLTGEQIKHRLSSQFTDERKKYHLEQLIAREHFGKIIEVDNSGRVDGYTGLYERIKHELKI